MEFEGEALDLIAHRAEGGMRNALTSLEQLIAFGEGKVTMEVAERLLGSIDTNDLAEIVRAIGTRDVASCFRWTAEYVETFEIALTRMVRPDSDLTLEALAERIEALESGHSAVAHVIGGGAAAVAAPQVAAASAPQVSVAPAPASPPASPATQGAPMPASPLPLLVPIAHRRPNALGRCLPRRCNPSLLRRLRRRRARRAASRRKGRRAFRLLDPHRP